MGKCRKMVGAIECGQETVSMSEYCETHQPTSAREFTVSIEEGTGRGGAGRGIREFETPSGPGGFSKKPGGIK